jgi:hypothetical protein
LHQPATSYRRHQPELTVLYETVERYWPEFQERAEEAGGLPRFVVREFEEYLRSGRLEHGCLHLVCRSCGHSQLVAFSCKRRGFCPSCLGRRMTDTAVHLVQHVLPEVRIRQWVCSLPWRLRYVCGYDRKLCAAVLGAFVGEISRSLRLRAKHLLGLGSVEQAHTGVVTFVQRFDSGLRLNVHLHSLVLDGVYVREPGDGPLVFHPLPAPSATDVADLARRTAERVARLLDKLGRSLDPEMDDASDPLELEHPALAGCYGAAARGIDLLGERAGQPTLRVIDPLASRPIEPVAVFGGFNVHAKVAIDGHDRKRLERICRYLGRPPIAQERLERLSDGRLRFTMKKPWRDGTTALLFEPLDLIARLCAMVPPPWFHMIRFHGLLAPHAKLRAEVVPSPPSDAVPAMPATRHQLALALLGPTASRPPTRKSWAWLLRHVFAEEVTTCAKCGGQMRWAEAATTPDAIAVLLVRHGLGSPRAPPPVRAPTLGQLDLELPAPT